MISRGSEDLRMRQQSGGPAGSRELRDWRQLELAHPRLRLRTRRAADRPGRGGVASLDGAHEQRRGHRLGQQSRGSARVVGHLRPREQADEGAHSRARQGDQHGLLSLRFPNW